MRVTSATSAARQAASPSGSDARREIALQFGARAQRDRSDLLAVRRQAEPAAAAVRRVGEALDEAGVLGIVGELACGLLGDIEQLGEAVDRRLLGGDRADHEAERRADVEAGREVGGSELVGEGAIAGREEDREVGLVCRGGGHGTKVVSIT